MGACGSKNKAEDNDIERRYRPGSRRPTSDKLYKDELFPARDCSLFYSSPPNRLNEVEWRRPAEITTDPKMFVKGASRMDINQGELGDCWMLAAMASLASRKDLFKKVVSPDQSFKHNYNGEFHFNIWQYGRWVEVVIDDRLPTRQGKLFYVHSDERDEFWSALLEKAYAKLRGSYEAVAGGFASDALVDFTGGLATTHPLLDNTLPNMFDTMIMAWNRGALMCCSTKYKDSAADSNGLPLGHAYTITDVRKVSVKGTDLDMVRVRNPWGNEAEWNGAWSDGSEEWKSVSKKDKERLGLVMEEDGEFWMAFDDFKSNFRAVDICFLGPDSHVGKHCSYRCNWESAISEGSWRAKYNAGGNILHLDTFWTNPTYEMIVVDPDETDNDPDGVVVIGLMKKYEKNNNIDNKFPEGLRMEYHIYKVTGEAPRKYSRGFFTTDNGVKLVTSKAVEDPIFRECSAVHWLRPGRYVIVVCTELPDQEIDYVLRVFSEKKHTVREIIHND